MERDVSTQIQDIESEVSEKLMTGVDFEAGLSKEEVQLIAATSKKYHDLCCKLAADAKVKEGKLLELQSKLELIQSTVSEAETSKSVQHCKNVIGSLANKKDLSEAEKATLNDSIDKCFAAFGFGAGWTIRLMPMAFKAFFVLLDETGNLSQAFGYLSSLSRMKADYQKAKLYKYMAFIPRNKLEMFRAEVGSLSSVDDITASLRIAFSASKGIPVQRIQNVLRSCGSVAKYIHNTKHKYLYPSISYCKEKFISQLLSRVKTRYKTSEVLLFIVPEWPELSFIKLMDDWGRFPFIAIAMPDRVLGELSCDREFFFTLVNTAYPHSMDCLFQLLRDVRHKQAAVVEEEKDKMDEEISRDIAEGTTQDDLLKEFHRKNGTTIYNVQKQYKNKHSINVLQSYEAQVEILGQTFMLKYVSPLDSQSQVKSEGAENQDMADSGDNMRRSS